MVLLLECPHTREKVARFTKTHAQKNGFSSLKGFKDAYKISYTSVEARSFRKIQQLYNFDYKRWVVGFESDGGMIYATKKFGGEGKSAVKFPLGSSQFNKHFNGDNPLAIFAYGMRSKFFTMDVDTKDWAWFDVGTIVDALTEIGIARNDIHVSFSGSKGYHVTLFSDTALHIADWHKIGDHVRAVGNFTEHDVEYRPNATNGHAVKLPLTLHPKTKAFAGYCDESLEVMDEQSSHDYLFAIEPMPVAFLREVIARIPNQVEEVVERPIEQAKPVEAVEVVDDSVFQSDEDKKDSAIRILNHGLAGKGTRWKAMRNTLIPYIKCEMGCDEAETKDILLGFCEREYAEGRTDTPPDISEKEIDALIEDFYPLVNGVYSVKREITISKEEVGWVVSVVENGGTRASRDLLWTLLLMRKAYGGKDGSFFASREQLRKLLSKPKTMSPPTLQKSRDWLAENGYITFDVPENSYAQRKATTYTVEYDEPTHVTILGDVTFDDEGDARGLLKQVATHLYDAKAMKQLKV